METKTVREYLILACILLCVFGVYLSTMLPVFKNNDSPETSVAAYTLGIGHPPGYPFFTMAAKIMTLLPLASPAFRVNLFSAFLALFVLVITYLILTRHIFGFSVFNVTRVYWVLGFGSVFILAFSLVFWNQALEAKGGIYMMNLLFAVSIILLVFEIFAKPAHKYFYLISFLYGLGLANHWPSMAILAPVLLFPYLEYRRVLKLRGFVFCVFFLALGLTPYLYLPARASAGAVLNWGDPSTLENFLWVVFRKAYVYPVKAGPSVLVYQSLEFIKLFLTNYSLLVIFVFAGVPAMLKRSAKTAWWLISVFLIVVLSVVVINRTAKDVVFLVDIFLLPAMFVCLLFMAAGMAHAFEFLAGKRARAAALAAIAAACLLFMFCRHYDRNNASRDYLSYDFGRSIMATMEPGSVYFGDGDFNLMPLYYLQEINGHRKDIISATASFLIFKWGIDDFTRKYGSVPMKPFETNQNILNIMAAYIDRAQLYRSANYPRLDEMQVPYKQSQKGLLVKLGRREELFGPWIYRLYSYRGVYADFTKADRMNMDLVGWYPVSMVNQANYLGQAGRPEEALQLYKWAMLFPNEKPEANIYFNMSLTYFKLNDTDDELACLQKALDRDGGMLPALERAGIIYFDRGLFTLSKQMLDKAKAMGSKNEFVEKALKAFGSTSEIDRYEMSFIKANDYINKNELSKAMFIYNFLLEKHYKSDIIYSNIGVYHFRTNDLSKALEFFIRSKNETLSPETEVYIAYTYFKMNNRLQAIAELEQGLKTFGSNKDLNELYRQLKGNEHGNEKNTHSGDGQR
jgi:tetratricopeptide (TPR) repeat protein